MSDRFARDKNEPFSTDLSYGEDTAVNPDEEIVDPTIGIAGTYAADDSSAQDGSKVDDAKDKAKHVADDAKHKAQDVAADAKSKANDVADTLKHKAEDLPSMDEMKAQGNQAMEDAKVKMGDAAHVAEDKADQGIDKAAGFMATASDKLEEQGMKRDDQVGDVATMAAEKMDTASQYLGERTSKDILDDIENLVREKPLESVLVAAGVGLLLSRVFS